jgi:branched-chain amino acid transport system permease protein
VRDSEVAAAVMGVDVRRYKAAAFTASSAYAGLAGVLLALAFGRIVPDTFGFVMSIDFLAMIIIGGLGSIAGAVAGAAVVTALPLVLSHYSDAFAFIAQPGEPGVGAAEAARLLYGVAVVAVLLFAPGGLAQLLRTVPTPAKEAPHEPTIRGPRGRAAPRADRL